MRPPSSALTPETLLDVSHLPVMVIGSPSKRLHDTNPKSSKKEVDSFDMRHVLE